MSWDRVLFLVLFGSAMIGVWLVAKWGVGNWGWWFTALIAVVVLPIYWLIDRRSKPDSE